MAEIGVIIVAGGSGQRMGSTLPKQFLMLDNMPILGHTINRIREALPASEVVVVLPAEHIELWRNLSARFDIASHKIVAGGRERFFSVKNGIEALSNGIKTIAIHDGVRPLVTKKLIIKLILEAQKHKAVIPVVAPADSFRVVEGDSSEIINRAQLRMVHTPQVFDAEVLRTAYEQPFSTLFTDDASVVEAAGQKITLIEGERSNIKITTPTDLVFAQALLANLENETQL